MAHQETSRGDWADTTFNPCSSACWQAAGPIVSIQCNLDGRGLTAPPVSLAGAICLRENTPRPACSSLVTVFESSPALPLCSQPIAALQSSDPLPDVAN